MRKSEALTVDVEKPMMQLHAAASCKFRLEIPVEQIVNFNTQNES